MPPDGRFLDCLLDERVRTDASDRRLLDRRLRTDASGRRSDKRVDELTDAVTLARSRAVRPAQLFPLRTAGRLVYIGVVFAASR
jgi:hypothetical protein